MPRGLATRRQGGRRVATVPLVRVPRTLPRILSPAEVDALVGGAAHGSGTGRWSKAMVLGGLRRCEVLGLRLEDLRVGERRVFIADGKGGHQRLVPIADRFFAAVGDYLDDERPTDGDTDRVFVVLKGRVVAGRCPPTGSTRSSPAPADGPGWSTATCHQLRHTCLTRLREAGMALEAVQAQAGHRSIESTRIYLHLANDWLAGEYQRAAALIDADQPPSDRRSGGGVDDRRRPSPSRRPQPRVSAEWAQIAAQAPQLAATHGAATWIRLARSSRPRSVDVADNALRQLAALALDRHRRRAPSPTIGRDAHRGLQGVARRPARQRRAPRCRANTQRQRLRMLRMFFERIIEWDWPDAPARNPIFGGDIPRAPNRCPSSSTTATPPG